MAENSAPPVAADTVVSDKVHGALTHVCLVVSATTSLGTLLVSVARDHESNSWIVGGASGLTAICLAVLFAVERKRGTLQKSTFWVAVTPWVIARGPQQRTRPCISSRTTREPPDSIVCRRAGLRGWVLGRWTGSARKSVRSQHRLEGDRATDQRLRALSTNSSTGVNNVFPARYSQAPELQGRQRLRD